MRHTERQEFIKYYEPIHSSLDRYCRVISGNKMDGEDLLHDTVLTTLNSFSKLENKQALLSYMFSVASRIHFKRARRKKFYSEWDSAELEQFLGNGVDLDRQLEFQMIYEKMMTLPDRMKETLILFYVSDLKMEKIHQVQGGSLSGVKLRLKRGKEKLLKMLTDKEKSTLIYMLSL